MYLLSLFWMYSIWILTRPRVFLPGAGAGLSGSAESSVSLTLDRSQSLSMCLVLVSGKGGRGAKGSAFVGLGAYRFSPSMFEEVDPAG